MPDNTTIRKFIRHPADVPIQVATDWDGDEVDDWLDKTVASMHTPQARKAAKKRLTNFRDYFEKLDRELNADDIK